MIKISVIIPMYNAKGTIVSSLDSVVNQSFKDCLYEVIVINDGSTDNCDAIVEEYFSNNNYTNITFRIISQENGGVSKARNTGLKLASGNFIAFLDSDDKWDSKKIELQLPFFKSPEVHFIATGFEEIYMSNRNEGDLVRIKLGRLIYKNYFQPSTVMMRSIICDEVGYFDESQRYAEEGDYFYRIANNFNCFFLNIKLLNYGDGKSGFGASGLSANLKEMERGELMNLKRAYRREMISLPSYLLATSVSILKYMRRVVIVKFR